MKIKRGIVTATTTLIVLLTLGVIMNASAGWFGMDDLSWKEEVVLHDGGKLTVERSQNYGGRHEVGQTPPIKEQSITFTVPGTDKVLTWKSDYSDDVGRSNFILLALHLLKDTPYIVASPNLCLSYNKWGRPNPPYVFFKHDGKVWQRIPLAEFPSEFSEINVVVSTKAEEDIIRANPLVSAELVKKINGRLEQPEYKTILREAYPGAAGSCDEMIRTSDGWEGLGFFKHQPSYEACLKYCDRKGVSQQDCPCEILFKGVKK